MERKILDVSYYLTIIKKDCDHGSGSLRPAECISESTKFKPGSKQNEQRQSNRSKLDMLELLVRNREKILMIISSRVSLKTTRPNGGR